MAEKLPTDGGPSSLALQWKGIVRPDIKDFSQYRFEVQLLYNTGWETVEAVSPFVVEQVWAGWKARKSFETRLLRDGKWFAGSRRKD